MKIYNLDTIFGFGKYKSQTLANVISSDAQYIKWCLINLEGFALDADLLDEFTLKLKLTEKEKNLNNEKLKKAERAENRSRREYDEPRRFERYEGTYAQDVAGYSDDDIDDIFGGEPDAYWNID